MLWIKALHVIFVVAWFAGLFYLPRLFVYHVDVAEESAYRRFCTMERRLYGITTIGLIGAWGFALLMLALQPAYLQMGWLQVKLVLALLLGGYHVWLRSCWRAFAERRNRRSARFYRIANEVPALFLVAMVILAIVKPF